VATKIRNIINWAEPDIGPEEIEAVKESVASGWIGGNGPSTEKFERAFAEKVNAKYSVATCNGTTALLCAFQALKEKIGKVRIAAPTFTFISTVHTAYHFAEEMRLIDCNPKTWNVNPDLLIGENFNLLVPVDVGGLPCDYNRLKEFDVPILADSAEAVGAKYDGKMLGSIADVTVFSFHAAKVITTGEGGIVVTNDKKMYESMRSIANYGYATEKKSWEYEYERIGFNYRMAEPQAALGLVQLNKLDKYLERRHKIAKIYKDVMGDLVKYQHVSSSCFHSYFLFGILLPEENMQEWLCTELEKRGIKTKITFKPAHKQKPYSSFKECPQAEKVWKRIIALPIHNKMSEEDAKYVSETVKKLLIQHRR
jgi:perosamine synthetase